MTVLKIYMKKRKLNKAMQMRVIRYFEYLYGEKKLYSEEGA